MNDRFDRRHIAPLLTPHFPDMAGAGSDEWHAFLNAATGLSVELHEDNAGAFDAWRKALAGQGLAGVWRTTPRQAGEQQARIAARAAAAAQWRVEQEARTAAELRRLGKIGLQPVAAP